VNIKILKHFRKIIFNLVKPAPGIDTPYQFGGTT
jgi:hypothetical protein